MPPYFEFSFLVSRSCRNILNSPVLISLTEVGMPLSLPDADELGGEKARKALLAVHHECFALCLQQLASISSQNVFSRMVATICFLLRGKWCIVIGRGDARLLYSSARQHSLFGWVVLVSVDLERCCA
jgi:hypothetical protein